MNNKDLFNILKRPGVQEIKIPRDKLMPLIKYINKQHYNESIDIDMIKEFDKGLVIIKCDKSKPKII